MLILLQKQATVNKSLFLLYYVILYLVYPRLSDGYDEYEELIKTISKYSYEVFTLSYKTFYTLTNSVCSCG